LGRRNRVQSEEDRLKATEDTGNRKVEVEVELDVETFENGATFVTAAPRDAGVTFSAGTSSPHVVVVAAVTRAWIT